MRRGYYTIGGELFHATRGVTWRKHKYTKKIVVNGKTRYLYGNQPAPGDVYGDFTDPQYGVNILNPQTGAGRKNLVNSQRNMFMDPAGRLEGYQVYESTAHRIGSDGKLHVERTATSNKYTDDPKYTDGAYDRKKRPNKTY